MNVARGLSRGVGLLLPCSHRLTQSGALTPAFSAGQFPFEQKHPRMKTIDFNWPHREFRNFFKNREYVKLYLGVIPKKRQVFQISIFEVMEHSLLSTMKVPQKDAVRENLQRVYTVWR